MCVWRERRELTGNEAAYCVMGRVGTFNNLAYSLALRTYPQKIDGIEIPVFNHEDINYFNELNTDLEKCNNALCQILNKFSFIR